MWTAVGGRAKDQTAGSTSDLTWKQTGRATGSDPTSPRPATPAPPEVVSWSVPTSCTVRRVR
jgi:hypothetical protein